MNKFALLSDNSCALTKDLRDRFGIDGIVCGNITYPDGHTEKADLDWERTTPEEYFGGMASKKYIYKTSCCNIDEVYHLMKTFAEAGQDILMITISSALSGTYSVALKASERIAADFPAIKVRVIDSLRYSTAIGVLLVEASRMRDEGKSMEEVAEWIEANKKRFHQMGLNDDMFFLARTGRVSHAKAFFGNLAGIMVMADLAENGLSQPIGKAKGKKNAINAIAKYVAATIEDPQDHILFICHSMRPREAEAIKEAILKLIQPKEIITSYVDQSSGANIGPGLAAAFYYGRPATAGLAEETKILSDILNQ